MNIFNNPYFINEERLKMPKEAFTWYDPDHPYDPGGVSSWDYAAVLPQLDLKKFPVVEDFAVVFYIGHMGEYLKFVSPANGVLNSFIWWDNFKKPKKVGR